MSDEPRLPRPDVAQLYARVREIDETLVLAAEDQDTELIRWYLSLDPVERLRRGVRNGEALARIRDARERSRSTASVQ